MVETIFTSQIFVETILPFLLIFTLVFAVLEKTEILGKKKRQIDAIVALVIGLTFVAFGRETDIVVRLIPIMGVALVVILVFMLLLGSIYQPESFKIAGWLKGVIGVLIVVLVAVSVLVITGGIDIIFNILYGDNSGLLINGFLILVIIGAIVVVVWPFKGGDKGSSDK